MVDYDLTDVSLIYISVLLFNRNKYKKKENILLLLIFNLIYNSFEYDYRRYVVWMNTEKIDNNLRQKRDLQISS
jgi:hypothetical protein